jgi:tetratricopeptide (TPR) repeat protein
MTPPVPTSDAAKAAPEPAKPKQSRGWLWVVRALVVALGASAATYYLVRSEAPALPNIPTDGLDAEVVAAIQNARADIEADPRSAEAWGQLGVVLFAQNMYPECIGVLEQAEQLDANNARWPYFRALALLLQNPDDGIAVLKRAAEIPPQTLHIRLRLAEQYLKFDRLDEAEALFQQLAEEFSGNPRVDLGRGQILSRRGRWKEAIAPLQRAALHPTSKQEAHYELAQVYFRLNQTKNAETQKNLSETSPKDLQWPDPYLLEAIPLRTGLQPRIDGAVQLIAEKKLREAGALIADVLKDHPDSDEAYLTRAKVFLSENAFSRAERDLLQALELNPKLIDAHYLYGNTRVNFKDYRTAEAHFRRAVELKPSYGMVHFALADCRLKMGQTDKAIAALRDAVRYRPDLAAAHVELGAQLLQKKEMKDAVSELEAALRLDPENERAQDLLREARSKKSP